MSTPFPASRPAPRAPSLVLGLFVAVSVGLVVGALTAAGQGWLSGAGASLANSAGPWSLAAFLVARYQRRVFAAIPGATATLACCEIGYVLANRVRDVPSSTSTVLFWLIAAALAGPPLGIAGAWSTRGAWRRAGGFAVIAGVLVGEGAYGWTTVADTTDWRYWALETVVGIAIVTAVAVAGRRAVLGVAAAGMASVTALVVFVVARVA